MAGRDAHNQTSNNVRFDFFVLQASRSFHLAVEGRHKISCSSVLRQELPVCRAISMDVIRDTYIFERQ